MSKYLILLTILLGTFNLQAQVFDNPQAIIENIDNESYTYSQIAGDFDQDGDIDFAGRQGFYFNQGDNTFTLEELERFSKNYGIVDVDNDGDMDMVEERVILENDGSNNFTPVFVPMDGPGVQIAVNYGDFNGDQLIDLVVVDLVTFYDDVLSIYYNQGDLVFEKMEIDPVFDNGYIHVGDYNGDDKLDIISVQANIAGDGILFYTNVDGTSFDRELYDVSGSLSDDFVELADMDGDNDLDAIYSGTFGSLHWIENSNGNFSTTHIIDINIVANWLDIGDVNADGHPDIVALDNNTEPAKLGYFLNDGSGNMGSFTLIGMLDSYQSIFYQWPNTLQGIIQLVDMDNDNMLDLVVNDVINHSVLLYKNINISSSANDLNSLKGFSQYPNPFTDLVTFEFEQLPNEQLNIQLYSIHGILIAQQEINESLIQMDCSDCPSSIYFYEITDAETNAVRSSGKLVKK